MNIETLLHKEIHNELEKLEGMEVGTDQHKAVVDDVAKLMDRAIEMERIGAEKEAKTNERADEQKDRIIRNVIAALGIAVPTILTVWGTKASFEFEKEGTITTTMGRGFINRLFPKK